MVVRKSASWQMDNKNVPVTKDISWTVIAKAAVVRWTTSEREIFISPLIDPHHVVTI